MKVKLILLLLCCQFISFANDFDQAEIKLEGSLSFKGIVREAEKQLGIDLKLPTPPKDAPKKQYRHTITIDQLIKAIMQDYANQGIPVDWKFNNHVLTVFRTDKLKRPAPRKRTPKPKTVKKTIRDTRTSSSSRIRQYPKQQVKNNDSVFQYREKNTEKSYPHTPDWVNMPSLDPPQPKTIEQQTPFFEDNKPKTKYFHHNENQAFNVVIPQKAESSQSRAITMPRQTQTRQSTYSQQPKRDSLQQGFSMKIDSDLPNEQPSYSSPKTTSTFQTQEPSYSYQTRPEVKTIKMPPPRKKTLRVTPYPENATAFINDAPSISTFNGIENYVEWETRMKGSLQQGNRVVLEKEKAELERRLRWLRKQL